MSVENELKEGINEFLSSAVDDENKDRRRSAASLYFKAIATLCDYVIYLKLKKIPDSHTERFRILETYFPSLYKILDQIFPIYQQTYRTSISKSQLEVMKNALERARRISEDIEKTLL